MDAQPKPRIATLADENRHLGALDARQRIAWASENLPGELVLSSSFGAQAAVCLHLATSVYSEIPVIFIDTGYLFAETYQFVDELATRLALNLKVYRAEVSSAWQEARHGQRWHQGRPGLAAYNEQNKVEPMRRALAELNAGTWIIGLRRSQGPSRAHIRFLEPAGSRLKLHPIADWTDEDVQTYLAKHNLPYHPLCAQGYPSIGDTHTTRPIHEAGTLEQTRFFGLKRECGIHEIND